MSNNPPIESLHTRKQTAARLGLSLRTVDAMISAGKLPHYRFGASVRLDPAEVDAALRARHHVATQTLKGHTRTA